MGEGKLFIGLNLRLDKDKGFIFVDQAHYAKEVLETYGMLDYNPTTTLIVPSESLVKGLDEERLSLAEKTIYEALVASLGFLIIIQGQISLAP